MNYVLCLIYIPVIHSQLLIILPSAISRIEKISLAYLIWLGLSTSQFSTADSTLGTSGDPWVPSALFLLCVCYKMSHHDSFLSKAEDVADNVSLNFLLYSCSLNHLISKKKIRTLESWIVDTPLSALIQHFCHIVDCIWYYYRLYQYLILFASYSTNK